MSLLVDGLLSNYLPFMVNDLSLFTPLFTLVSISLLYPYYRKREKHFFIMIFITGMVYDLFYTNLVFFNGVLFLLIACFSKKVFHTYEMDYLKLIVYLILVIVIYESVTGLILFTFHIVPITFSIVLYKITHSLILNIIYGELVYLILNKLPKKYKKISIN